MTQEQANKIIANWRRATKELEAVLAQPKGFSFRWATFAGECDKIVVQYFHDNKIFICGTDRKYTKDAFDSLEEVVQ